MHAKNFRQPLRQAVAEIDSALDEQVEEETERQLAGIAMQFEYYLEGDTTDPEALIYPPPGALETIQGRLTDVIEHTNDPAADHLRKANSHLRVVISALRDRMNEGRYPNSH